MAQSFRLRKVREIRDEALSGAGRYKEVTLETRPGFHQRDETVPVGFGFIQVVPVWRLLLEIGRKSA